MKVLFLPEVRLYLKELIEVLVEKEYFSSEEYAERYVTSLIFEIENTLPLRPSRKAPPYFDQFGKGMDYTFFIKNKNTQWYVFFVRYKVQDEIVYLVRYISNNHTIAQYLYH